MTTAVPRAPSETTAVLVAGGIRRRRRLQGWLRSREGGLLLVIGVAAAGLSFAVPEFLTRTNFLSIGTGMIYDLPMATGMTLVLIMGGIDLSVGAVLALTSVVAALLLRAGVPVALAVTSGLFLAAGIGAFNGLLVTRFRLQPFIVTLSTMSLARGSAVVLTSGYMVSGLPGSFVALGRGQLFGVPVPIYVVVVLLALLDVLLKRWRPLHDAFYVGHNVQAARLSGISVARLTVVGYVVCAISGGLAALFMTSRLAMGYAQFGDLAELRAIAAAVLGGASFTGGTGSVLGSALGVLLLAIVLNGFVLLNLSIYWQSVASGLILLVAVGVDAAQRRQSVG